MRLKGHASWQLNIYFVPMKVPPELCEEQNQNLWENE